MSLSDALMDLARGECRAQGVSLPLILGIIHTESSGDPWAYNPEPKWKYMWDCRKKRPFRATTRLEECSEYPPDDFFAMDPSVDPDAEWWGQQASWGLMQVMGAVAREMGFSGHYLTQLCDPEVNLRIGCAKVVRLLKTWGDPEMAACAYNRGSIAYKPGTKEFVNQAYVTKVMTEATRLMNLGVA